MSITPELANDLVRVFLADAYRMRLRRAGKTVDDPIAVGELLTDDRQPATVVVAGVLHDDNVALICPRAGGARAPL